MKKLSLLSAFIISALVLAASSSYAQIAPQLSISKPTAIIPDEKGAIQADFTRRTTISHFDGASTTVQAPLLYIVDGVLTTDIQLKALNSNQIQKIEILKGSKAIALHGPSAANGVVLVTTKK